MLIEVTIKCQTGIEAVLCYMLDVKKNMRSFCPSAIYNVISSFSFFFFSIRRHQERRAILTPILTDFTVRITAAPAIIFTKIDAAENLHPEVSTKREQK